MATKKAGFVKELKKNPKYKFLKKMNAQQIKDDQDRTAKPVGWRFKGEGNYAKPTKEQVKKGKKNGKVYFENRPNRSDVSKVKKLVKGGKIKKYEKGGPLHKTGNTSNNPNATHQDLLGQNQKLRAFALQYSTAKGVEYTTVYDIAQAVLAKCDELK